MTPERKAYWFDKLFEAATPLQNNIISVQELVEARSNLTKILDRIDAEEKREEQKKQDASLKPNNENFEQTPNPGDSCNIERCRNPVSFINSKGKRFCLKHRIVGKG